mgnify:CR=1 FL=1
MDDMMKIHLLIDNERYPMTIRREDEQLYRDAAKQIDNKLNKYRSYYPDFTPRKALGNGCTGVGFRKYFYERQE